MTNQTACPSGGEPDYNERLDYERRILAAECGTQRILNEFEAKLRRMARQARSVPDALDPKAAEIIDNIATMVHDIDVTASPDPAVGATAREDLIARLEALRTFLDGVYKNGMRRHYQTIEDASAALARAGGSEVRRDALEEAGAYLQSVADEQRALGRRLQQQGGYSRDDVQACFVCARHYQDAAGDVRALSDQEGDGL